MPKIEIKINKYVKCIGKDDLILDNGACIQVVTQEGPWSHLDYAYAPLPMSKKLFKDLKTCGFIYIDEKLSEKANEPYKNPFLTYYRFDIDQMIKSGDYKVVY